MRRDREPSRRLPVLPGHAGRHRRAARPDHRAAGPARAPGLAARLRGLRRRAPTRSSPRRRRRRIRAAPGPRAWCVAVGLGWTAAATARGQEPPATRWRRASRSQRPSHRPSPSVTPAPCPSRGRRPRQPTRPPAGPASASRRRRTAEAARPAGSAGHRRRGGPARPRSPVLESGAALELTPLEPAPDRAAELGRHVAYHVVGRRQGGGRRAAAAHRGLPVVQVQVQTASRARGR